MSQEKKSDQGLEVKVKMVFGSQFQEDHWSQVMMAFIKMLETMPGYHRGNKIDIKCKVIPNK